MMLFSRRKRLADELWPRWVSLHDPLTRAALDLDKHAHPAFAAGAMMAAAEMDRRLEEDSQAALGRAADRWLAGYAAGLAEAARIADDEKIHNPSVPAQEDVAMRIRQHRYECLFPDPITAV